MKKITEIVAEMEKNRLNGKNTCDGLYFELEKKDMHFHKELVIFFLKKHNTIFSSIFLVHCIKFLKEINLNSWEFIFQSIVDNNLSMNYLNRFLYHYVKIDFFKTFSNNELLAPFLETEYSRNKHLYSRVNSSIEREFEILKLNTEDFKEMRENLIKDGAVEVSVATSSPKKIRTDKNWKIL